MNVYRAGTTMLLPFLLCGCRETGAAPRVDASETGAPALKSVKFAADALARLGVRVAEAGSARNEEAIFVPGTLEYNFERYAEVGAVLEGRVRTIEVRVGDRVKRGQLLGTVLAPSIAQAQADYVAAEAAAKNAKRNVEREDQLLEKQLTTGREAEVARADATRTEAEFSAARARLSALGVTKPERDGIISGAGTLRLVAPLDGVVVRRDAVLGRFLSPQEHAFVIADPFRLRASLNVFEADLVYFRVGSEVDIRFDAVPGKTVKGTVSVIDPQVGRQSRSARALIDVPNEDGSLRPGLFLRAGVKLPGDVVATKLLVPAGAVQPLGEDSVVFVERAPGTFEVRKVVTGQRTPQVMEVTSGLSRGERIAVDGAFLLRGEVTKQ